MPFTLKTKLPNRPSDLIMLALKDLEKVEKLKNEYKVDMLFWHSYDDWRKKCNVCFAGAVMAMESNAPKNLSLGANDFGYDDHRKFVALDFFRTGSIGEGLEYMGGIDVLERHKGVDVTPYSRDPDLFKAEMRGIARGLKKNGY